MNKKEAIKFLKSKCDYPIYDNNTTYSSINNSKSVYWFTIPVEKFKSQLNIVCYGNDELIHINLNANLITAPESVFRYRRDRNAVNIEIPIEGEKGYLKDIYSDFDFKPYSQKYQTTEIPLTSWIEHVVSRSEVMSKEALIEIEAYNVVVLGNMHFEEYKERLSDESKSTKQEFAKSRMKGYAYACDFFNDMLDKNKDLDNVTYENINHYCLHAEASFLGAKYLAISEGIIESEINKFFSPKKTSKMDEFVDSEVDRFISTLINGEPGDEENEQAYTFLEDRKIENAKESAFAALEKSPNSPKILDTIAFILYINKEYDEAFKYSTKCIDKEQTDGDVTPEHLSTRIKIYIALGRFKDAKNDKISLSKIDPDYKDPDYITQIINLGSDKIELNNKTPLNSDLNKSFEPKKSKNNSESKPKSSLSKNVSKISNTLDKNDSTRSNNNLINILTTTIIIILVFVMYKLLVT